MRIISGKYKGQRIPASKNLPVRPTTDLAKESLFNILSNRLDFDLIKVLDLFSGTGNISYEFYSRGVRTITAVDASEKCVRFIKETIRKFGMEGIEVYKSDVFKFLPLLREPFDLIFADPPYDLDRLPELPDAVFKNNLLSENGILIIEHASSQQLQSIEGFEESRRYGQSSFSFFNKPNGL